MNKNLPLLCPSCSSKLAVKALFCEQCSTEVTGLFNLPVLASLTKDEQIFILDFVKFSGSLKDMAKKLNLSYPTVRNMLDSIIEKIQSIESQNKS